jgi:hypothetical protein
LTSTSSRALQQQQQQQQEQQQQQQASTQVTVYARRRRWHELIKSPQQPSCQPQQDKGFKESPAARGGLSMNGMFALRQSWRREQHHLAALLSFS